jgi:hypothetical protein
MRQHAIRVGVSLCALSLWASGQLCAGPAEPNSLKLAQSTGVPVTLLSGQLTRIPSTGAVPLGLQLRVKNTADQPIRQLEVHVEVVASDGGARGFHGFTIKTQIPPGEEQSLRYLSPAFELEPGDRVTVALGRAESFGRAWRAEGDALHKDGPTDTCDARCAVKEEVCTEKCTCGTAEFSCSCGIGTLSYTCKCYRCI